MSFPQSASSAAATNWPTGLHVALEPWEPHFLALES